MPDRARKSGSPRHSYRTRHRSRSHESAHAAGSDDGAVHHDQVLDHPLVPRSAPVELVATNDALAPLIEHMRSSGSFAYDSEFIGELSYHPKLCLIQVATSHRVTLIDPLADIDLVSFWELVSDGSVEKIVHAGEQDLEPATRLLGKPCANVFDTQISAGFVGLAYPVALGKLVHELVGTKLPKGLTFTHWDQRPLSTQQLRYAANDVRYLPAARAELGRRLERVGHASWAKQECDALCDPSRYVFDPEHEFLRIRGAGSLSCACLAVLRELTIWRDSAARDADVPPRALLRDEVLLDMARSPIKSLDKLARVRGLPRPIEQEHGGAIVELTQRALTMKLTSLPSVDHVEPTPAERFRVDAIWALVQALATGQSIDPALVASRNDIAELHRLLRSNGELSSHRLFNGWRHEAMGDKLLAVIREGKTLALDWVDDHMRATIQ